MIPALLWPALGLVYISGAMCVALMGLGELKEIATNEPDRRVLPVALAWSAGALFWPVALVAVATIILFGDL